VTQVNHANHSSANRASGEDDLDIVIGILHLTSLPGMCKFSIKENIYPIVYVSPDFFLFCPRSIPFFLWLSCKYNTFPLVVETKFETLPYSLEYGFCKNCWWPKGTFQCTAGGLYRF